MTRIISGTAKGRTLQVPKEGTRPTSDRVRESLFTMLHHDIGGNWSDAVVLDLFAGTGAFGLEALSRGAKSALAVELDDEAFKTVQHNCSATHLPMMAEKADAFKWVTKPSAKKFNLVYIDPPYDFSQTLIQELVANLVNNCLSDDAIVLIERSSRGAGISVEGWECSSEDRKFGDTTVQKLVW
jgi:16S rRNA (guanine966-N2)-methyltransferase